MSCKMRYDGTGAATRKKGGATRAAGARRASWAAGMWADGRQWRLQATLLCIGMFIIVLRLIISPSLPFCLALVMWAICGVLYRA